jgi:hypothetical protein
VLKRTNPDRKVIAASHFPRQNTGFERMKQAIPADRYFSFAEVTRVELFIDKMRELMDEQ